MNVQSYSFKEVTDLNELAEFKAECLKSLTSPQDGMWEYFRNSGEHWGVLSDNKLIGYASIGEGNQLLQFYITPKYLLKGKVILKDFIDKMKITSGLIGTNNLNFLSVALGFVKELIVHSCLFRDSYEVNIEDKEGDFKECQKEDLEKIVEFCHYSMGAPKEWLLGYIGDLVNKREIFFLENGGTIIGTCEVRKSKTTPNVADVGMVVSPDFRRKGYGSFLLNKAKTIALEGGSKPICSCEQDNVGSLKSIQNCGFISRYQLLLITFK